MANGSGSNLGFEERLWTAADKLRGTMDASEYKHVVLGLIFLKYINDTFIEFFNKLQNEEYADPEDRDEYTAENIFWLPKAARWEQIQNNARSTEIGVFIDDAMKAIEEENPRLRGILAKDYARPSLDKIRLGQLIDLISTIGLGDAESRAQDILGRVYEYFLGKFASSEGKGGGEFYTPQCIVRLLVEMLEPFTGRVYDPCCGSGGMFVQAKRFVQAHSGNGNGNGQTPKSLTKIKRDISIYGQESNYTTWRLCQMNLAIRGIEGHIEYGDSFTNDKHPDLRADYLLANPPFNMEDWGFSQVENDPRWRYGKPPQAGARKQKDGSVVNVDGGNANYAWIQHFIQHLNPLGMAGFVMANGSMSTSTTSELVIRTNIIEADLVDCMIALPGQLFYTTPIPVCLWFISKSKAANPEIGTRGRQGETLFIDARKLGVLTDRVHRELTAEEIERITATYHAWRGEAVGEPYEDISGYCKSASLDEIRLNNYVLTPGRYVGIEDEEDDGIPFEEKMELLSEELLYLLNESNNLDKKIIENLKILGYDH
ncbi:MAG: class I SAM-dependent DNA methyltransferase [Anaerolineaceae bacterium]|jgi:type I restriction enzyme M protein|nr:class I SAM-dependent DNA methyltransferase [Anaerolineaceae bacterium]